MSDFLGRLAARALGAEAPLRPRLASRFEPEASPPGPLSHRPPALPGEGDEVQRNRIAAEPHGAFLATTTSSVETPRGASPDLAPVSPSAGVLGLASISESVAESTPAAGPIRSEPRAVRGDIGLAGAAGTGGTTGERTLGTSGVSGAAAAFAGDAPRGVSTVGGRFIGPDNLRMAEAAPVTALENVVETRRLIPEHVPTLDRIPPRDEPAPHPQVPQNLAVGGDALSRSAGEGWGGGSPSPGRTRGQWERGPGGEAPIRVTIGRIEVRAAAPAPPAAPVRPVAGPRMNLEDYLRRRREGKL